MAANIDVNIIEKKIDEIADYIRECKPSKFSTSKVVVSKDEIQDMLDQLKLKLPEEFKRCQKLIQNRESIIQSANLEKEQILEDANNEAYARIDESVIVQQAYVERDRICDEGEAYANDVRRAADEYFQNRRAEADYYYECTVKDADEEAKKLRTDAYEYVNGILGDIEEKMSEVRANIKLETERINEILQINYSNVVDVHHDILKRIDEIAEAYDFREEENATTELAGQAPAGFVEEEFDDSEEEK